MANITVGQIMVDAQRMVGRVKDLDSLGSALLVEAEGNNRLVESLRQFQNDIDLLNRISNNKSNADIVNRIHQQNANSSEILKENRELKICIEDYERALELVMQKYRDHTHSHIIESKINFRELYNEKLWTIIRGQREKINEMAAVMQRAVAIDDSSVNRELELISRLRIENKTLRELLQISKEFGSFKYPIRFNDNHSEEKSVQTDLTEFSDDLSLSGGSIENANNNSVIQLTNCLGDSNDTVAVPDNAVLCIGSGVNNNISELEDRMPELKDSDSKVFNGLMNNADIAVSESTESSNTKTTDMKNET